MRLPKQLLEKHDVQDMDTLMALKAWDEPPGGKVLEVGAHDEPAANVLAEASYRVVGVDLRAYDPRADLVNWRAGEPIPEQRYEHVQADFCDLPFWFLDDWWEGFDAALSISALEHFGLGTYGEGAQQPLLDAFAVRQIWHLLKPGGVFYLVVPFGKDYIIAPPHWRIYGAYALAERLVQDFTVEGYRTFAAGDAVINGQAWRAGSMVPWEVACQYKDPVPHVSILVKMRKVAVKRQVMEGR